MFARLSPEGLQVADAAHGAQRVAEGEEEGDSVYATSQPSGESFTRRVHKYRQLPDGRKAWAVGLTNGGTNEGNARVTRVLVCLLALDGEKTKSRG